MAKREYRDFIEKKTEELIESVADLIKDTIINEMEDEVSEIKELLGEVRDSEICEFARDKVDEVIERLDVLADKLY